MSLYDILDQLRYECGELHCLHCNAPIPKTDHNIHKGECWCAKCRDWNAIEDCRANIRVQIYMNNNRYTDTSVFHQHNLFSDKLVDGIYIINFEDIIEIKKNGISIYQKEVPK